MIKPCAVCGQAFKPGSNRARYCSDFCRGRTNTPVRQGAKNCPVCNTIFEPRDARARYCSDDCRRKRNNAVDREKWRKKCLRLGYVPVSQRIKYCDQCGAEFHPKLAQQKRCSRKCSDKARNTANNIRRSTPEWNTKNTKRVRENYRTRPEVRAKVAAYTREYRKSPAVKARRRAWWRERNPIPVRTCPFCATSFRPIKNQKTCGSPECKNAKRLMHNTRQRVARWQNPERLERSRERSRQIHERNVAAVRALREWGIEI